MMIHCAVPQWPDGDPARRAPRPPRVQADTGGHTETRMRTARSVAAVVVSVVVSAVAATAARSPPCTASRRRPPTAGAFTGEAPVVTQEEACLVVTGHGAAQLSPPLVWFCAHDALRKLTAR